MVPLAYRYTEFIHGGVKIEVKLSKRAKGLRNGRKGRAGRYKEEFV